MFATLKPLGKKDLAKQVTFSCAVVERLNGRGDFAFEAVNGSTMKEQNIAEIISPIDLKKPDSEDFYGFADSNLNWAIKVQKCQAQLFFDKFNLLDDLLHE